MEKDNLRMRTGWIAAAALALLSPAPSIGQAPGETIKETGAARLEEMGRVVRTIRLFQDEPGGRRPVEQPRAAGA
jgi:hypothetical protein